MEAYKASSSRWGRCCSGSATRTRAEEIIGCSDEEYGRFDVSEADSARADLQASRKHRISRPNAINVHRPQVMSAPLNGHELLVQRLYRPAWQEITFAGKHLENLIPAVEFTAAQVAIW